MKKHVLTGPIQSTAELADIYRGLLTPIPIHPGLLPGVQQTHKLSQKISRIFCNFQKISMIFRRRNNSRRFLGFPGELDTLYVYTALL